MTVPVLTSPEYLAEIAKGKPRKYRNVPTIGPDGTRFASKAEAARDAELQKLERAGLISDLKRQPRFPLVVNGAKVGVYVADWSYRERIGLKASVAVVEDKKGVQTQAFKIKWKLVQALYPSVNVWRLS